MFTGALTALITPFKNGAIDEEALRAHVEDQIGAGIHGLVPVGTTGESATLTHEEHQRVVRLVIDQAAKRVPVIAGTGSNNTREAIQLTLAAKRDGADGSLLIAPYYNRPTQEGLYQHFAAIATETGLPLIVYNIPGRTGVTISAETLIRLSAHDAIYGVKDATGNTDIASAVTSKIGDRLVFLSGDDAMTLPFAAIGGQGVISALSNLVPGEMVRYATASMAGDMDTARSLHRRLVPLIAAIFVETNPIPVKTAMAMLGKCTEEMRLPLCAMSDANRTRLREALTAHGLRIPEGA